MRSIVLGVLVGISVLIVLCLVMPMPALMIARLLSDLIKHGTGSGLNFVGGPGEVSSGAVVAAATHVLACLLVAKIFHRYSKRSVAVTVALGGFLTSALVYVDDQFDAMALMRPFARPGHE